MATKAPTNTAPKAPRKARTPRVLSPAEQETANAIATLKSQAKEAKSIGKVVDVISTLTAWGLGKLNEAITARQTSLANIAETGEAIRATE